MKQSSLRCLPLLLSGFFLSLFLLQASPSVFGDEGTETPRLSPDPAVSALAAKVEPMNTEDLVELALIASGVPEDERLSYSNRLFSLMDSLPPASGDIPTDAETVLQWMHEEVLNRYVENQTRIDVLLDEGTYNCVSSAVLYLILASERNIPVYGVYTVDHAFCRVPWPEDPEGGFDVETTIAFGFDPGRRHDAVDTFSGRTGFVYVPPSSYRSRTDIGEKALIALIYQNRLAALQRSGKWTETVGLARDRWELAGNTASRRDFITSLSNYAAEMNRRNRQVEALSILADASLLLGDSHGLEDTAGSLLHNAVTLRINAGDIEGAQSILESESNTILVSGTIQINLQRNIDTSVLESVVEEAGFNTAVSAVDEALESGLITASRWNEFTLHLWSREAQTIAGEGTWLDGWYFLNESGAATRSLLERRRVIITYAHNAAVVFHNAFVDAVQAGLRGEATSILDEAQSLFPDDTTLKRDRRTLDSMTDS